MLAMSTNFFLVSFPKRPFKSCTPGSLVMDVGVGCSHPRTSRRYHPLYSGGNNCIKIELDFIKKTIEDGVGDEILHCTRRLGALECRFAGYLCDYVRKFSISPHSTHESREESFALNWIAVHGSKAISVVIRRNDLDNACLGPFYQSYPNEVMMFYLTQSIMSKVADLAELSCPSIEKPYSVVSVDDFLGKGAHKQPSFDVEKTIGFLKEKMQTSCSEYTYDNTTETAISAFKLLCNEELTASELYVLVCEDISLAPYYLMPYLIEGFLNRGST